MLTEAGPGAVDVGNANEVLLAEHGHHDAPPASDEIEITLLGRGFGESVLLHVGAGEWIVIDSLYNSEKNCAPLSYLKHLGVDPIAVSTIVATHWHDDHVGGISELYEQATSATFILPLAMQTQEFAAYANTAPSGEIGGVTRGVSELVALRKIRRASGRPAFKLTQAATIIRKKTISTATGDIPIALTALSPCAEDVEQFITKIGQASGDIQIDRRLMPFTPNDVSVAAWFEFGGTSALLGADLEQVKNEARGWSAVVASQERPQGRASVFKLPHHGSENGHNEAVWSDMMLNGVFAMLAPFNKGWGVPKTSDVARILAKTGAAFVTTQSPFRKYKGNGDFVEKALGANGIVIRSMPSQVGIITYRKNLSTGLETYSTRSGATHMKQFVARD